MLLYSRNFVGKRQIVEREFEIARTHSFCASGTSTIVGGIKTGAGVDALLNKSVADALSAWTFAATLAATIGPSTISNPFSDVVINGGGVSTWSILHL